MPDLRRPDEEVDDLMGLDVPTIRGTSEDTSENNGNQRAAALVALPVKAVTAEMRRETPKSPVDSMARSEESRSNQGRSAAYYEEGM